MRRKRPQWERYLRRKSSLLVRHDAALTTQHAVEIDTIDFSVACRNISHYAGPDVNAA